MFATERDRDDVLKSREDWKRLIDSLEYRKTVFIDETCVKTDMIRMYGRAPRGQRVLDQAPRGKRGTMTFVAGLGHDRVVAPYVFNGAMNGRTFAGYLKKAVVPALPKGSIIIADNLSSHKVKEARTVVEKAQMELWFLPPYSPDFNPIEQLFSKLKQLLRGAVERCVEGLSDRIGSILDTVSPAECFNYFLNVGYGAKTT